MNAVERLDGVTVQVRCVQEFGVGAGAIRLRWSCSGLGFNRTGSMLDDVLVDLAPMLATRIGCDLERLTLVLVTA